MTLPTGQHFDIITGFSPFNCDISTNPTEGKYIATSVGGAGQSTICWECAEAIYKLVASERMKAARSARIPSEPKLRVAVAS